MNDFVDVVKVEILLDYKFVDGKEVEFYFAEYTHGHIINKKYIVRMENLIDNSTGDEIELTKVFFTNGDFLCIKGECEVDK